MAEGRVKVFLDNCEVQRMMDGGERVLKNCLRNFYQMGQGLKVLALARRSLFTSTQSVQ